MSAQESSARFRQLHQWKTPLLLPNAWDAGSARWIESNGAQAIATSSAAVAWAHGYADGGALPPSLLPAAVAEIARVISVPISVDVEAGYSAEPRLVSATVEAATTSGDIDCDLEMDDLRQRSRSLTGKLGGGEAAIVISTTSGDISIS